MKEFFEEYGRTIVTVLIILGIILVGYVIAGNGRNSAFGTFTSDVVDSLSGQANDILEKSSFNSWKIGNSDVQDAIEWNDTIASTTIKNSVPTDKVKVENIVTANPMSGMVHRVTLKETSSDTDAIGSFSRIKIKKADGTLSDALENGKKYRLLFYIRGEGTWNAGLEQASPKTYDLTEKWQKVSYEFTASKGLHAFIQYRTNGGKAGDYCDVTGVYISEAN